MNDTSKKPSKENPNNVEMVCDAHAPKPGKFTGQDANTFLGKYVKRAFKAFSPITGKETLEHMWVKVHEIKDGILIGTLDNNPVLITQVEFGDQVTLTVGEIEDVSGGSNMAVLD